MQRLRHVRVEDEACDVLFGHSGQLVRENILKAYQPHQNLLVRFLVEGVANDMKLYHTSSLLQPCSLISCRVSREETGLKEKDKRSENSFLPSVFSLLSWMCFSHNLTLMQDKLSMFSSVTSTITASNCNHSTFKIKLTAADQVYTFLSKLCIWKYCS